jgi:folylpolyglutamate synthase/dihydropteroate synthase
MKHARPDYNRIQDPAGLIPEDEPVFLVRGQDRNAPETLRVWAAIAQENGAERDIVNAAYSQAEAMEAWQAQGHSKVPDLPK